MSDLRVAIHKAAVSHRGGIESIAAQLGVSGQILRNQLVGNDRHKLPIETAETLMDILDSDALADAAARQRSGVFVKLPAAGDNAGDLAVLELVTHVWRANGDIGLAIDDALADGRVDRSEVERVRKAIYAMQKTLHAMLQRLEGMAE